MSSLNAYLLRSGMTAFRSLNLGLNEQERVFRGYSLILDSLETVPSEFCAYLNI